MATITALVGGDGVTTANSMTKINANFDNLNNDKIETSVLDTDTTLAANSDAKIPSQKAVKAYVDTQGGANASETVRGVVEEATDAEVTAGTATGATGAKLFVSPAKLSTRLTAVVTFKGLFGMGSTSKNLTDADAATQTIAHGLGVSPLKVMLRTNYAANNHSVMADGSWSGSSYISRVNFIDDAAADTTETSTSFVIKFFDTGANLSKYQTATVAVDATNITLTWTKTSTPTGTVTFLWEAMA